MFPPGWGWRSTPCHREMVKRTTAEGPELRPRRPGKVAARSSWAEGPVGEGWLSYSLCSQCDPRQPHRGSPGAPFEFLMGRLLSGTQWEGAWDQARASGDLWRLIQPGSWAMCLGAFAEKSRARWGLVLWILDITLYHFLQSRPGTKYLGHMIS